MSINKELKETAKQLLRKELSSLSKELNEASPNAQGSDIDKLRKHNQILDRLMLRMLSNADNNYYINLKQYSMALRAQNQYRQTVMATDVLKQREEKEIAKNAKKPAESSKQTEQITS